MFHAFTDVEDCGFVVFTRRTWSTEQLPFRSNRSWSCFGVELCPQRSLSSDLGCLTKNNAIHTPLLLATHGLGFAKH